MAVKYKNRYLAEWMKKNKPEPWQLIAARLMDLIPAAAMYPEEVRKFAKEMVERG